MKKLSFESIKSLLLPMEKGMSEGEEFIRDFLDEEGFTWKSEAELRNLKGDSKSYRIADFYLPKFGLYIEFLGHWNTNAEHRERYTEKMRTYYQNGVPCVYLFPENPGTLKHSFRRRARIVLARFGMRKELLKFNLIWFWKSTWKWLIFTIVLSLYTLLNLSDEEMWLLAAGSLVAWYVVLSELYFHLAPVQDEKRGR
jgi:hypothetical protein